MTIEWWFWAAVAAAVALVQCLRWAWPRWAATRLALHCGDECEAALARAVQRLASLEYVAPVWARLWAVGRHLHTAYAVAGRSTAHLTPLLTWRAHTIAVAHGGSVRLDEALADALGDEAVLVVIVPGIAGSSQQHYVRAIAAECLQRGWRPLVFNHRGCGGQPLTSAQLFTFGGTGPADDDDLVLAMRFVRARFGDARLLMVGCSLGANLLLNFLARPLAERGPVFAAVSVCQAFDARRAHAQLNKFYARMLLNKMLKLVRLHSDVIKSSGLIDTEAVLASATNRDFEERFTLRVHRRWRDVDEYYHDASCLYRLADVHVPTLMLNALDDPLVPQELLHEAIERARTNKNLAVAVTDVGGHLGHACGFFVPSRQSFAEQVIGEFFSHMLPE